MSEVKRIRSVKAKPPEAAAPQNLAALGRKRDQKLDTRIMETAIDILAAAGFDSMTMDMVAAHAKVGKASVYRRWPSKAELVRDAIIWMSRSSVELDHLPDTGSLRDDLLALMKPYSTTHETRKLRVVAGLGSFFTEHKKLAEETTAEIFELWTDVKRKLMQRAVERGEIPRNAAIEMACQVIVSMTSYRVLTQRKPFDKTFYGTLLDSLLLPALKNAGPTSR